MNNKKRTCFGCDNLKHSETGRGVPLAYCGATDSGLIIPHSADRNNITYTRVPEFCPAHDRIRSNKPAAKKYWETCESLPIIRGICD